MPSSIQRLFRHIAAPFQTPAELDANAPPEGTLSSWLFVRLLGLTYLIAFLSLWPQILGLIGQGGMLPAAPYLGAVADRFGSTRWHLLPTLFWLDSSDGALRLVCLLGSLSSLLLMAGVLEPLALLFCWACYLSYVSAGRDFLGFQWDALLLESALFALPLCLARPSLRPGMRPVSLASRALLFALLFRFMFAAGWAKLRSGDPSWRDLSALNYHFFTQPLPTVLGYYAHQLPAGLKAAATFLMFAIELGVPLLILIPRLRRHAFLPLVLLQLAIAATGNYGFFNLLTTVLCVPLLPDAWLRRVLPARLLVALKPRSSPHSSIGAGAQAGLILSLAVLTLIQGSLMFLRPAQLPAAALWLLRKSAPFEVVNRYGLFAVMTKERPEIIIEGSMDGASWEPYEFKYKAGALDRRPRWNAPHQPRLDWQLWFAALGAREDGSWFDGLCIRLLQGSPEVLKLIERAPFSGRPPRFLRATLYQYTFTTLAQKRQSGRYFERAEPEVYLAPVSLEKP